MILNRIFALVIMAAGTLMAGVALMSILQVNATMYINRSPIDLGQLTNNDSSNTIVPGQGDFDVILPPIENTINCALPSSLLNGGGDCYGTVKNDKMLPDTHWHYVYGNEGDDYLIGGNISDALFGSEGNDVVYGGIGNDSIAGNEGEDRMFGGPGDDTILAGQLRVLQPGYGSNHSEWPPFKDFVNCGEGYDRILVDNLDVYLNCELVNGERLSMDTNRDFSNLTRLPDNDLMDSNRDITNLTRFP